MKAIYRHKTSGDIFAIETDEVGNVISTCGPLLFKDLDPKLLDYDDYWNTEISTKLGEFEKIIAGTAHTTSRDDFERLTREEYRELLIKNGFVIQSWQRKLF